MKKERVACFILILVFSISICSAFSFSDFSNIWNDFFGKITGKISLERFNEEKKAIEISESSFVNEIETPPEPQPTANELSEEEKKSMKIVSNLKSLRADLKSEREKLKTDKSPSQMQKTTEAEKNLENYMSANNIPLEILQQIEEINAQATTWTADFNRISIKSDEEKNNLLGLIIGEEELKKIEEREKNNNFIKDTENGLPDFFDWRDYSGENYITSVKDQGNCGSCWAFGAVASTEGVARAFYNNPNLNIDLSEQDLVSCFLPGVFARAGCNGAYDFQISYIFSNYSKDTGLTNESCFPYTANNAACSTKCSSWQASSWKDKGLINLDLSSPNLYERVEIIKNAIINNGPVEVGMAVYNDFSYYQGGIYRPSSSNLRGYHAVTIVGFGEYDGEIYWIVKNSWAEDWGENGYFRIFAGESMIDSWFAFIPVEPYPAQGSIVKLCGDNDGDSYCNWGIGDKPDNCPVSCSSSIEDCDDSNPSIFQNCGMSTEPRSIFNISSDPSEADVYVKTLDSGVYRYLGKTPLQKKLHYGLRTFKIEKKDYISQELDILADPGQISYTNFNLETPTKINGLYNEVHRFGEIIKINGSTSRLNFINYTLLWGVGENPQEWFSSGITLTDSRNPVVNSELGVWDTSYLGDSGIYTLKLVSNTANIVYEDFNILYIDKTIKEGWPVNLGLWEKNIFWFFTDKRYSYNLKPVIYDINKDGYKEIIVANNKNNRTLSAFSHDGNILWESNFSTVFYDFENNYNPSNLLAGDFNNDGFGEIIAIRFGFVGGMDFYYSRISIFDYNGNLISSAPLIGNSHPFQNLDRRPTMLMADLNNDEKKDIVIQENRGHWVVGANYGFSGEFMFVFNNEGSGVNIDNSAYWGLESGASNINESLFESWKPEVFDYVDPSPAIGNFDSDSDLEIVSAKISKYAHVKFYSYYLYSCYYHKKAGAIYVYNRDGSVVSGWPIYVPGLPFSSPVVGDINNDGQQEIIVGLSKTRYFYGEGYFSGYPDCEGGGLGGVYAFHRNGSLVNGWPVLVEEDISSTPVLGDLNGDGFLEVGVSSINKMEGDVYSNSYLLSSDGEIIQNWEENTRAPNMYSSIIADIDGDGSLEILSVVEEKNFPFTKIYARDVHGNIKNGFPKFIPPQTIQYYVKTPIISVDDIDKDGKLELIASSSFNTRLIIPNSTSSSIYVWDLEGNYNANSVPWPQFMHDAQHTGCYDCLISNCNDSDGGLDYFKKGKIKGISDLYSDICLDDKKSLTLIEYSCASQTQIKATKYTCSGECISGRCIDIPSSTCIDSDLGENPSEKGSVVVGKKVYPDKCKGKTAVKEQVCVGGKRQEKIISGLCFDGRIISEIPTPGCRDYDGGDIYTEGVTFYKKKPKLDVCMNEKTLKEYVCKPDRKGNLKLSFEKIVCPLGCGEGRCAKSPA